MNPRTTVSLFVVAAALGAFLYFYEIGGEEQRREAEQVAKRLFPGIEPEELTSIAFATNDGVDARIERREAGWSLVEPLEFPGDAFATDGLADTLATLTSEAVLESPQGPEEYGLGDDARVVGFDVGGESHQLRLGAATPVGSATYASTSGSDDIYTVATFKANSFDKSVDDLREKRILDFDRSSLERLEASWPGGAVTLARDFGEVDAEQGEGEDEVEFDVVSAGPWRLVSPVEGPADEQAVEGLLSDLDFLRASGFVDEPLEPAAAGFEPPAFEIRLFAREGTDPVAQLAVGDAYEGDTRLVRAGRPTLYTIAAARLDDFPRELMDYRFKELASFGVTEAEQVDLYFQPKAGDPVVITLRRGDGGWSSEPEPMQPAKISGLVSQLSRLRATGILAEGLGEEELRELGLAPPNTIVTVFGRAEEGGDDAEGGSLPVLAELQIGVARGSDWIAARAAGDPAVYQLDYGLAEYLPLNLAAFRNRFLAEPVEPVEPAEPPLDEDVQELLNPAEESP